MGKELENKPIEEAQKNERRGEPRSALSMWAWLLGGLIIMTGVVFAGLYADVIVVSVLNTKKKVTKIDRPVGGGQIDTLPSVIATPPPDTLLPVNKNLAVWLRADAIENPKHNKPVSVMPDGSGRSRHAKQIMKNQRPKFIRNGINGKPVVRFDGNDDYLFIGDVKNKKTPTSIFAVWAKPKQGGKAYQRLYSSGAEGTDYENGGAVFFPKTEGFGVGAAEPQIHAKFKGGQGLDLRSFHVGRLNSFQIQYFFGDLAELLIYDRKLSDSETKLVKQYLSYKYNL